tara:strand:- start:26 stop:556 length:531 start_codon:yes stop_codon:yes gene_type:complete
MAIIKIIDNCCSPTYLECLKHVASNSENWHMKYPIKKGTPIEDKILKIDIKQGQTPFLAGLAMGLLIQIYETGGRDLFIPEIIFCGISIKDKHRVDNVHMDTEKKDNYVKILGILNSDWEEKWGGGFIHNEMKYHIKPTSFCIFDPSEPHVAEEIFTDKKRFAIDFTVKKYEVEDK